MKTAADISEDALGAARIAEKFLLDIVQFEEKFAKGGRDHRGRVMSDLVATMVTSIYALVEDDPARAKLLARWVADGIVKQVGIIANPNDETPAFDFSNAPVV